MRTSIMQAHSLHRSVANTNAQIASLVKSCTHTCPASLTATVGVHCSMLVHAVRCPTRRSGLLACSACCRGTLTGSSPLLRPWTPLVRAAPPFAASHIPQSSLHSRKSWQPGLSATWASKGAAESRRRVLMTVGSWGALRFRPLAQSVTSCHARRSCAHKHVGVLVLVVLDAVPTGTCAGLNACWARLDARRACSHHAHLDCVGDPKSEPVSEGVRAPAPLGSGLADMRRRGLVMAGESELACTRPYLHAPVATKRALRAWAAVHAACMDAWSADSSKSHLFVGPHRGQVHAMNHMPRPHRDFEHQDGTHRGPCTALLARCSSDGMSPPVPHGSMASRLPRVVAFPRRPMNRATPPMRPVQRILYLLRSSCCWLGPGSPLFSSVERRCSRVGVDGPTPPPPKESPAAAAPPRAFRPSPGLEFARRRRFSRSALRCARLCSSSPALGLSGPFLGPGDNPPGSAMLQCWVLWAGARSSWFCAPSKTRLRVRLLVVRRCCVWRCSSRAACI